MIDLIDRISDELVLELARLGWPPLADLPSGERGRILVGQIHQFGQCVPPRVVMRPTKSTFEARMTTLGRSPSAVPDGRRMTDDARAAIANPAILSEPFSFDVRCWSACPVDEPLEPRARDLDYTFTRGLYNTLIAVLQRMYANAFAVGPGVWMSQRHVPREGQEFMLSLTIGLPVLKLGIGPPTISGWRPGEPSRLAPKAPAPPAGGVQDPASPHAPPGTEADIQDFMFSPDGTQSEPGCED